MGSHCRVYGTYTERTRRADGDAFEVTSLTAVADASVMAPLEQSGRREPRAKRRAR
jgi:hypothetical protein